MDIRSLAKEIDGIEYPCHGLYKSEIVKEAARNRLVICYGASDDLLEFAGAIDDEVGCYEGCTALVDTAGLVLSEVVRDKMSEDDLLEWLTRKKYAKKIKAIWSPPNGSSWLIESDIVYENFDIMEDGELFGRGIVFSLDNL